RPVPLRGVQAPLARQTLPSGQGIEPSATQGMGRAADRNDYLPQMRPEDVLLPTSSGVCCKLGGFHIDPTRPVEKALITHGHSDHARAGHGAVLATQETLDVMRIRYGDNFAGSAQAI